MQMKLHISEYSDIKQETSIWYTEQPPMHRSLLLLKSYAHTASLVSPNHTFYVLNLAGTAADGFQCKWDNFHPVWNSRFCLKFCLELDRKSDISKKEYSGQVTKETLDKIASQRSLRCNYVKNWILPPSMKSILPQNGRPNGCRWLLLVFQL